MKILSQLILAILIISHNSAQGRDLDWFDRRSAELDKAISQIDSGDKIESLATFARIGNSRQMDEEQRTIFKTSQTALLQVPGHAQHYQSKLESLRSDILSTAKLPEDPFKMKLNSAFAKYEDFREEAFPVLGLLPSSETVAVLGHFLNDPEGRDGKDTLGDPITFSDAIPFPINAGAAAIAIRKLGIEHPPFLTHPNADDGYYTPEEIDAWKDWWNEVKDGKRTYHFIGSSIEYGPDGPASKEQLQRIERSRQREASSKDPKSAVSSNETDGPPHTKTGIAIGGTVLLLLASIFYVLRTKKRSSW